MIYEMNLNPGPFEVMKSGLKTIEMRLDDERRKDIKIGDIIIFIETVTKEQLKVEVLDLYRYPSFEELYKHFDKVELGYQKDEEASPNDMLEYYPKDKIEKYGVLGIRIKLLHAQ